LKISGTLPLQPVVSSFPMARLQYPSRDRNEYAYQDVGGNRRPRRWLKLELAPPVPPLYDRPRNLKSKRRRLRTPNYGFDSFEISAFRTSDERPTKHAKHTKRIRGREVVALISRFKVSRVSCVLLAKFHGPVRSVEFATVVLTRRMWLRPSGLDFGRSVSAALPRGWILAAPFPGDSTPGLSSRAWQPATVP
jgi:hypothetical protein